MTTSKLIAMIAITLATTVTVNAQEEGYRTKFTGGLKMGANLSNVYDSEGEEFDADAKLGLAAGAFLVIPIGRAIGIQPEVLFSQKGFQATGSFLGSSYKMTRTTNYLDIPVFFTLKPVEAVTILAGPQFSYLLSRNDKFTNGSFSTEDEQEFSNDDIRRNTVCFVGGLDINVNHVVIGARVGWDLFNNAGDGSSDTPRYKNVWGQATIGFRF